MTRSRYLPEDGSIARARRLRREQSAVEAQLWISLRAGRLGGAKFRGQQRIGPFFADFVCQSARLVIEIDGDSHAAREEYDAARTQFLAKEGYRVIRFTNEDVRLRLEGVLMEIARACEAMPSPSHASATRGPLPLPRRERHK